MAEDFVGELMDLETGPQFAHWPLSQSTEVVDCFKMNFKAEITALVEVKRSSVVVYAYDGNASPRYIYRHVFNDAILSAAKFVHEDADRLLLAFEGHVFSSYEFNPRTWRLECKHVDRLVPPEEEATTHNQRVGHLVVDEHSRVACMLVGLTLRYIAVIPLVADQAEAYLITLPNYGIVAGRDLGFLARGDRADPLIGILHEPTPTTPGNLIIACDTCCLTVAALNVPLQRWVHMKSFESLPHDSYRVVPDPAPSQSTVVISPSAVVYISLNSLQVDTVAVNPFYFPPTTTDSSRRHVTKLDGVMLDKNRPIDCIRDINVRVIMPVREYDNPPEDPRIVLSDVRALWITPTRLLLVTDRDKGLLVSLTGGTVSAKALDPDTAIIGTDAFYALSSNDEDESVQFMASTTSGNNRVVRAVLSDEDVPEFTERFVLDQSVELDQLSVSAIPYVDAVGAIRIPQINHSAVTVMATHGGIRRGVEHARGQPVSRAATVSSAVELPRSAGYYPKASGKQVAMALRDATNLFHAELRTASASSVGKRKAADRRPGQTVELVVATHDNVFFADPNHREDYQATTVLQVPTLSFNAVSKRGADSDLKLRHSRVRASAIALLVDSTGTADLGWVILRDAVLVLHPNGSNDHLGLAAGDGARSLTLGDQPLASGTTMVCATRVSRESALVVLKAVYPDGQGAEMVLVRLTAGKTQLEPLLRIDSLSPDSTMPISISSTPSSVYIASGTTVLITSYPRKGTMPEAIGWLDLTAAPATAKREVGSGAVVAVQHLTKELAREAICVISAVFDSQSDTIAVGYGSGVVWLYSTVSFTANDRTTFRFIRQYDPMPFPPAMVVADVESTVAVPRIERLLQFRRGEGARATIAAAGFVMTPHARAVFSHARVARLTHGRADFHTIRPRDGVLDDFEGENSRRDPGAQRMTACAMMADNMIFVHDGDLYSCNVSHVAPDRMISLDHVVVRELPFKTSNSNVVSDQGDALDLQPPGTAAHLLRLVYHWKYNAFIGVVATVADMKPGDMPAEKVKEVIIQTGGVLPERDTHDPLIREPFHRIVLFDSAMLPIDEYVLKRLKFEHCTDLKLVNVTSDFMDFYGDDFEPVLQARWVKKEGKLVKEARNIRGTEQDVARRDRIRQLVSSHETRLLPIATTMYGENETHQIRGRIIVFDLEQVTTELLDRASAMRKQLEDGDDGVASEGNVIDLKQFERVNGVALDIEGANEIIDDEPEQGILKRKSAVRDLRLRVIAIHEEKAPVAAVTGTGREGKLITASGTQTLGYDLFSARELLKCSFLFSGVHGLAMENLKNFILLGDARQSLALIIFMERGNRLTVLGKHSFKAEASSVQFMPSTDMYLVNTDPHGNVLISKFDVDDPAKRIREELDVVAETHTPYRTAPGTAIQRVRLRNPFTNGFGDDTQYFNIVGHLDGAVSAILPLPTDSADVLAKLCLLVAHLMNTQCLSSGVNYHDGHRALRDQPPAEFEAAKGPTPILVDAAYLTAFNLMPRAAQQAVADRLALSVDAVLNEIALYISRVGAF
ncbi:CPSF A subunit region [Carpediemonas membranifera]|uniref:CPSF A subunit region n=1 Tax=Carpediemonas membranifera TaxID=201153 RepID=A0A8J6B2L7_9EUKA|nr:CPSF A subunit region [Carpediemonas membranifera]|eukprot:KAG9394398.1 CPSF A subunit region [Carpediemonas membranifera]